MENTLPVETSAQSNLEVTPPASAMAEDWASRLDAQIDGINKETSATRYGKTAEEKPIKSESKGSDSEPETKPKPAKKEDVAEKNLKKLEKPSKSESPEKAQEKAGEEKSDAKEEVPKGLTEKAAVKWGELRAEAAKAKEYVKTIESLKAELESVKTATVNSEELEQLRQINQQYEQELAISRVEATQAYKQNVVEPMVNVVEYLGSLASKYELNSREMLSAFAETDPAKQSDLIADLAASMNERDRLRFYASADDYAEIIRRRDHYHATSKEQQSAIEARRQAELSTQQQESEKSVAAAREEYEQAADKVFEDMKESVPLLADEEVASEVQRLAKGDYSGADAELKAYMAHSGALLPHLLKALKEAKAELEGANQKIAGYRNSSPKAGSGSAETSRSLPEDVGFLEALEQQLS